MTSQRAVLFDFGGVLIRMDWDGYDEFGKRWNLPAGTLVDAFYRTPEWHAIETGRGNWETWQRGVEQRLSPYLQGDVARGVQDLLDAWYAQPWQYHHPNFELAHDLQANGHKIGVLSNAPDDLRDRFLSNLPVEVSWDAIVVSGEIGMRKPDPGIFHHAADEIGVAPEHCFFIDDLEENVLGAQAIGMGGYHFTRNNYRALRIALRAAGIDA
ncbi:MAG: HAD family phosphatase [Chloroflexi bacterium]|nr:HAD family phosphatase [Chloroflexota bacterium]MXX80065.1 HAD family phosphatase [Chloroflexota bacterium]MYB23424.1 HAD family phosphatase [Chloroflexota bacterium]MYD16944.1 HAD family phosphatase [Chloroflexota bacterium]MYF23490.1 HAD family phosphatase [Chloroflexota bacterium]